MCVCIRDDGPSPPTEVCGGTWSCKVNGPPTICTKVGNGTLPPGGQDWRCHQATEWGVRYWYCYGQAAPSTLPGGNGWQCHSMDSDPSLFRCSRQSISCDGPPGGGFWACARGSQYGGVVCEKVDSPPQPPVPVPIPGMKCRSGQRMWCDDPVYSGWGQVACDPATNTWETTVKNGKTQIDCHASMAGGKIPDTFCAKYHFYFNPDCCERLDCIVPDGTSGQLPTASTGKLCDYCNPLNSECKDPGAMCVVTNAHETFCAQSCASQPCPTGYTCLPVKLKAGSTDTTKQCIPGDMSCLY